MAKTITYKRKKKSKNTWCLCGRWQIPHKLVESSQKTYHIPNQFPRLLQQYFDRFNIRFISGEFTNDWQRL